MLTRRTFIESIGLGLSAMLFTPHLVHPSWKDTLRANAKNPFVPHWALLRQRWLDAYGLQNEFVDVENLNSDPSTIALKQAAWDAHCAGSGVPPKREDFVFIQQPWYDEMYPEVRSPMGVYIPPFEHMPPGFDPTKFRSSWWQEDALEIPHRISTHLEICEANRIGFMGVDDVFGPTPIFMTRR